LISKLFGKKQDEYGLDVIAVLLNGNGKIANPGENLKNGDVIFYNNMKHGTGKVWLTGDNRTGEGEGDDEQVICELNGLPHQYKRIAFVVQIYQGIKRNQQFGAVNNAFIRAVDAKGKEMVRFAISNTPEFHGKRSMILAELQRNGEDWEFKAIGTPFAGDSFVDILLNNYA
jgi:tellurium resistance protein TerD